VFGLAFKKWQQICGKGSRISLLKIKSSNGISLRVPLLEVANFPPIIAIKCEKSVSAIGILGDAVAGIRLL
jgi:hypothetical protein